jgi:hypothetical protein
MIMEESAKVAMLFLALSVVLPLLPAFILFKFLPSTGDVSGPLKGLNVKFGGAFGAYLVVFLALLAVRPQDLKHYHTWRVVGQIQLAQARGEEAPNIHDVVVRVVPPHLDVMNGGTFAFDIPVLEDERGNLDFPDLQLDLRSYQGITVPLNKRVQQPYGWVDVKRAYDEKARTITIQTPLTLQSTRAVVPYDEQHGEKVHAQP